MIVAGRVKRVAAALITVALLVIGALVSSGLLVPLLLMALLVVLFRRRVGSSNEECEQFLEIGQRIQSRQ